MKKLLEIGLEKEIFLVKKWKNNGTKTIWVSI